MYELPRRLPVRAMVLRSLRTTTPGARRSGRSFSITSRVLTKVILPRCTFCGNRRWACASEGKTAKAPVIRALTAMNKEAMRGFVQRFMVSVQRLVKTVGEGAILRGLTPRRSQGPSVRTVGSGARTCRFMGVQKCIGNPCLKRCTLLVR